MSISSNPSLPQNSSILSTGWQSLKTVGSTIYNSKIVQSSIEKVGFVSGYAKMRAHQYCFGKNELHLPASIENNVIHGTYQNLDKLIGVASSEMFNKVVSPLLEITDPIAKGFIDDKTEEKELVTKYKLPKEILEDRFTDLRNFILNSRIHFPASYYKHAFVYDSLAQDIKVLVDGQYVGSKTILRNFKLENRIPAERMFLPPVLVHTQTKERYCYLENGLTQHDVDRDFSPYKTLPPNERPQQPTVRFNFRIDAKLETPEDAKNFLYHAWCELVLPSGSCYSFGVYGKGVAQCPDPTVYGDPNGIRSIAFPVTPDKARDVIRKVQELRSECEWNYHFTQANCASFITKIGETIGIDISEKDAINLYDSLITRIKMYAISSLLADQLRQPDIISKIGSMHELANLSDQIDRLPVLLQTILSTYSLEDGLKPAIIANLLQGSPAAKSLLISTFAILQNHLGNVSTGRFSDLSHCNLGVSAQELKGFTHSLLTGTTAELTYKIYNLLDRIFTNYYNYNVHSPGFVYERVVKEKRKQRKIFTPSTIM